MDYNKTDWINYRSLKEGELIKETDEVLDDKNGWRKTRCPGGLAPNTSFTSHRMYRRLNNEK